MKDLDQKVFPVYVHFYTFQKTYLPEDLTYEICVEMGPFTKNYEICIGYKYFDDLLEEIINLVYKIIPPIENVYSLDKIEEYLKLVKFLKNIFGISPINGQAIHIENNDDIKRLLDILKDPEKYSHLTLADKFGLI